jgi:hypothetical protein
MIFMVGWLGIKKIAELSIERTRKIVEARLFD